MKKIIVTIFSLSILLSTGFVQATESPSYLCISEHAAGIFDSGSGMQSTVLETEAKEKPKVFDTEAKKTPKAVETEVKEKPEVLETEAKEEPKVLETEVKEKK